MIESEHTSTGYGMPRQPRGYIKKTKRKKNVVAGGNLHRMPIKPPLTAKASLPQEAEKVPGGSHHHGTDDA